MVDGKPERAWKKLPVVKAEDEEAPPTAGEATKTVS